MAGILIRLAVLVGISLMKIQCIEISHWGNYFVFTFLQCSADNGTDVENIIVITTRNVSSNINIMRMETNETWDVSLAPFEEYKLNLNSTVTAFPFGEILPRKAVVVMASTKVSVYGFSAHGSSVDGFLVIPVAGLGDEYRTVSPVTYGWTQIAVVAVEDETELNVTFIKRNGLQEWNQRHSITLTLSTYDVLNIRCFFDSTGSLVQSSKPVAVLSGSVAYSIPTYAFPNHVVEMMPPIKDYGSEFVLQAPTGTDYASMYRVIFHEYGTYLMFGDNGESYENVFPGEYKDIEIKTDDNQQFCVYTSKHVLVVLFKGGRDELNTIQYQGDAYMIIIPPSEKYGNYYVVPYSVIANATDRLAILGHTAYRNLLVPQVTQFESPENCYGFFETSIVALPNPSQIESVVYYSVQTFTVLMYGYNVQLGYGFPAGFNVTDNSGEEECLSSPCLNNGWCIETSLSFWCYYPDGLYTGLFGETEMTTTASTTANYNSSVTTTTEDSTTESLSSISHESTTSDIYFTTTEEITTDVQSTGAPTTTDIPTTNVVTTSSTTEEVSNTTGSTTTSLQSSTESNLSTTTNVLTPRTLAEEASNTTSTTTISPQSITTKYPARTNSTTAPIPEFRRIYFLCQCPCGAPRWDTKKRLLVHEAEQKNNILNKNNLSKTQRQKTSADNITELEQDLGFSALVIMTSMCSIIILLDLLRLVDWIKGFICRQKPTLKESQKPSWCSHV